MKNIYKVILMALIVLGAAYAGTETKKNTEDEACKYKLFDLCKFPVNLDVGHYVRLENCHKRKIELKQVQCEDIGQTNDKFPCYKGCDTFKVKANFPAIFSASIDTGADDKDMLKEVNLYWNNGVNTIKGTGEWEELTLCLEAWSVEIWKSQGIIGSVGVGEITIKVKVPDEPKEDTKNNIKEETKGSQKS
ncbi:MAG: hypothetical protein JW837_02390 [Sedimentisphaerales bacterium]|nr:hypothetical protein [Sedimentisphaerales bacterium]